MRLYDGGYSDVQYNTGILRSHAQMLADFIPRMMQEYDADCIAVMGKSGISLAFATLMLIDFPIMVVRKRGENSHGNPIEGTHMHVAKRYLILDDFVSSGETVRNIVSLINEKASFSQNGFVPQCAAVLAYKSTGKGSDVRIDDEGYIRVPIRGLH